MTAITIIQDATGTDRTISKIIIRDAGGIDRTVQKLIMRDAGGVDRDIFIYFSATANADYFYGSSSGGAASGGPINTAVCTVTLVGGSGGESYAWTLVSYDRGVWTATSPATNATAFTVASAQDGLAYNAVWRCTIVDGSNSTTVDVNAAVDWFDTR